MPNYFSNLASTFRQEDYYRFFYLYIHVHERETSLATWWLCISTDPNNLNKLRAHLCQIIFKSCRNGQEEFLSNIWKTRDVCQTLCLPERHAVRNIWKIFDPMTSKSIEVISWLPSASMPSFRAIGAGNVELSLWQAFCVRCHCDLDLWSNYFKIKRGHLLVRPNLQVKFED